jgi:nitroreductase
MDVIEAIYKRRAARDYIDKEVDRAADTYLVHAAIQAPSALNEQPWAFGVIQSRPLLKQYSDRAKAALLEQLEKESALHAHRDMLASPDFNIFYNAGTLIVIYAKPSALHPAEDCCLAAQNLMLVAYGLGLGSCPIGFARPWLDLPDVKRELGVPATYTAVFPVVVGFVTAPMPPVGREEAEILFWK